MIEKLIERYELQKELSSIKKHFRIAKKQKSLESLEEIKYDLLDFQKKVTKANQLTDFMLNEIFNLFAELDYVRLKYVPRENLDCEID